MKGAVWQFPEIEEYTNDILPLNKLADIDTTLYGTDLKTITYHPVDSKKTVSVVDNNFVLWDLSNGGPQVLICLIKTTLKPFYSKNLCLSKRFVQLTISVFVLFRLRHQVLWRVKVSHGLQMVNGILTMEPINL